MLIKVRVKTKSGEQKIEDLGDGSYLTKIKSAPEDGKANMELIKMMKKHFRKDVKIKSGFTSRDKIIEVED